MCTTQWSADWNAARLREFRARLQSIIGGSSETELKLLAVTPTGVPSAAQAVTMVTPVAKAPSARRNSPVSNGALMSHLSSGHYGTASLPHSNVWRPKVSAIRWHHEALGVRLRPRVWRAQARLDLDSNAISKGLLYR